MQTRGPKTTSELLLALEPVVEANLNRHLAVAKEWFPHEYVPWSEGRDFDGVARRRGVVPEQSKLSEVARDRADRQPAHRGQPAQLPPRDRHDLRPRRRVGHLGAPVDRRGGPARHRDPRLPARHPRRRPGRAGAGPDDAHGGRLHQRRPRRRCSRRWPTSSFQELATRVSHRNTGTATGDPLLRPAAGAGRRRREPAHGLLPQPARRGASSSPRTRRCAPSPTS